MEYSAGNLELSILGFSEKAVASIDVTAKALRRLATAIDKINSTQFVFAGQKLEVLFTKIEKATNSINTDNITNLASAAKSLSSISRLSNLDKMDFEKVGKGFNTLSVAIQPFLNKVREAEASLTALDGIFRRSSGKKIQGLLDGGNSKGNRSSNGIFSFAKRFASIYMLRRMGRFMGDLVQAGSDYTETLNLWQVAMRRNLDVADQFVNKMQKAYGISSKTLMNAQAVFKNMIGSLGQISDQTAYALSEALVQMSADYASLYNRTLESAFKNMQSMLAGQVRPIRSAGLDMTETTLFQFYQQIGGTKTMRQLNRTEKQLLSILAVYQQMGSAGALGDMSKTLNQFANQSRMMTEYWRELKTWSGLLLKDLIDQSGLLIYINATLITITEVIKAIAKSRGIGEENFIDGMFESAEIANDEIDELQGKLLDFDKFRSLEGANVSPIAIDEKLLEAITGYSSKIDQSQNDARKLAEEWMRAIGFTEDANGNLVLIGDNLKTVKRVLTEILNIVGVLIGLGIFSLLVKFGTGIYTYGIKPLITLGKAIYTNAIAPLISWIKQLLLSHKTLEVTRAKVTALQFAFAALSVAFLGASFAKFLSTEMSASKRFITMVLAVAGAITAAAVAVNLFHMNWAGALSAASIVAGSVFTVSSAIPNFEKGASDIDSGTIFRAGEFGKTEAVFTGSNGKTNVANIQQMKTAYTQSLNEWWAHAKHDIPAFQGVSESGIYTMVDGEARRRGKTFSNVR